MREVKFIPESNAWLVDGRIIKNEELNDNERRLLMAECNGHYELIDARKKDNKPLNG